MTRARGDRRRFRNEDMVLRVLDSVSPSGWDETRYEPFLDELCGYREYQKEAIRATLRYLLGGRYQTLRTLATENFQSSEELRERYGTWANFEGHLQLPDQLSCSLDQATGTGKSFVLYGLAAILLAEGAVDRVLVLCPSTTIEDGLQAKFRELASRADLRGALPGSSVIPNPAIVTGDETLVAGTICVENYHAILDSTRSSIRESLRGIGARVAVLNDEAHHAVNEASGTVKRWKEFLQAPEFGFRVVVGVSGTCYVGNEYFAEVIHRYSLRQAIEERFVKKVEYVAELPAGAESPEERWQLIYERHADWMRRLKPRGIRPLTIVVTKGIAAAEQVQAEIIEFLEEREGITSATANQKVICVTSAAKHQPSLAQLRTVDSSGSKVEWIVSVSMLSEGWDVKNVFQIVPHEERAFDSRLLIAQVLGRGLRRPDGWTGEEPIVTVFNHDSWSGRIKALVDEILEIERRLTTSIDHASALNFSLHHLDYTKDEDTTTYAKKGEYKLFEEGFVDLPTQVETESVVVGLERAVTGERVQFRSVITHQTWSAEEIAEQMYLRLKSIDDESAESTDPNERTQYAKRFPRSKCLQVVEASLTHAGVKSGRVTDENRQRFLQALGTLRRRAAKRVVYTLNPKALVEVLTRNRHADSVSAAELRRGSRTVFLSGGAASAVKDEEQEFLHEVLDEDGDFAGSRVVVPSSALWKTPMALVIADSKPERTFIRELTSSQNVAAIDGWLKSTPMGFYSIEYAWKKGEHPKRGEFSPDFFIRQGERVFVVEIKGDEEIVDPATENVKKCEYSVAHFDRLNHWLEREGIKDRYQVNFLSPKDYGKFFQLLRDSALDGFRSALDVALLGEGST